MPDYTVKPDIDTLLRSDDNAAARTNLGAQAALTTASPLGLNQGGTGAITASAALAALSGVPTTRTVSVGTGLTGGGDLSANRTISISSISTSQITGLGGAAVLSVGTTAGTVAAGDDSRIVNAALKTLNNTFSAVQTIAASASTAILTAQQTGGGSGASLAAIQTATGAGPGLTVDINNTSSTAPAVRITNQGAGASLLVEDSNPDTTPFTISASGRVGVGVTPDASAAVAIDAGGIKFNDGTVQTTAATGGGGTVTSVNVSGGTTGITTSGGPVTNSGTITLGGTLAIANGGTGATTRQSAMDALAGSTTSGQYLRGNGTDVVMSAIQAADVPTLNQNTTGTAANVTGIVAIANGGTGQTTSTAALNALLPTQTGNTGKVLSTDGANATWTTASGAPSGPAGGDLTGTYPNPTLAAVAGLTSGQYGSASSVAQVTVNAKGQTTLASNVAIAIATSQVTGLSATALGAITQLTGDVTTTAGGGSKAATLATVAGLTAGQYGSASSVAQVTVNAKGLLTLATNVDIAITTSQVSGLNADAVGALALTGGTVTGPTIIDVTDNANAALRVTQSGTAAAIVVEDSANPDATPFVVNQDGRVLVGKTTARAYGGGTPSIQCEGTSSGTSSLGLTCNTTTAGTSPVLFLSRTRGTATGSVTSVVNGDEIGNISFQAADGTNTIQGSAIRAYVDGTVGTNDMPGAIQFLTRGQGQASSSTRMTISSAGKVGIGTTPDATAALKVDTNGIMFGDGTTQTTAATGGTGTVTSITAGTGLTGGIITTSGTIAADFGSVAGKVTEGGTTVLKAGDTMTGKLTLGAGGTTSPLNLGASTAPVSPLGGDLWLSSGNVLSYRGYNSATYPLVSTAVLPSFTAGVSTAIGSATVAALTVQQNGAAATMTVANVSTSTGDCVTITNLGTGNSLVVNDETTPDSTRFAVANNGRVGIGVAPDASVALTVDSTGIKFSDGSVQTTGFFTGSATYDPPSLAAGASTTTTVTCTGALTTHFAQATLSSNTGLTINAYVSAANTVTVQLRNDTGATLDVVSGTLKVRTSL